MVYFEDTGAVFDAPIEYVWEYITSEHHGSAHSRNARNFEVKETIGSTTTMSAERLINGRWSTFLSRSTDFPPFCICNEEVEGDFAGTKFVILYRPHGRQTVVDAYGDIQSKVYPGNEAKRIFLGLLQGAYEDDSLAMQELVKSR